MGTSRLGLVAAGFGRILTLAGSEPDVAENKMPKLTKKEGLFLSRLHDQGGRIATSGNKYDRLISAGYVLSEDANFRPDAVHLTLTATGRAALEIHEKKARGVIHSPPKRTSRVT
jgi:hypothetical protein